MKEEPSEGTRPNRDKQKPGKTSQPFDPANESRSDRPNGERKLNLSKPPKRDVSGRRIDVEDSSFGIELW